MILVTGATGTNGSELVRRLSASGVGVRALVRSRAKAAMIEGENVEIYEGDFDRPETLVGALEGVESIFLVTSPGPGMVGQEGNMIEAARRAAVRHIVKLSVLGADAASPLALCKAHGQIEQQLKDSGISFTSLRPCSFMQNTMMYAPNIKTQGAIYAPAGDTRTNFVDARDIVAVAARALTESAHEGQTYDVTGPELLTYADIAGKLSEVTGRKVSYVDVPPEAARQAMVASGMSEWLADALGEIFRATHEGFGAVTTTVVADVAKKQPFTYDQFARDHAQAFI